MSAKAQTETEIFALAENYVADEQYHKAIFVLDKLIEKDRHQARYYSTKAYTHYLLKEYRKSESILCKGIELMPDSIGLYISRASLYGTTRNHEKAIKDCNTAIEMTSDTLLITEILVSKASNLGVLRDFENSYRMFKKILSYDPNNTTALNNIAMVCDEVGKPEETLVYLRKLIELAPKSPIAHMNIGFKLQALGRHKKAIEFFDNTIELDSKHAYAYNNRAFSELKLGQLEKALKDVEKSIELDPYNSYAYKNKALINIENKEYKKACKELHTAKRLNYQKYYGNEVEELIQANCLNQTNKI